MSLFGPWVDYSAVYAHTQRSMIEIMAEAVPTIDARNVGWSHFLRVRP